MWAAEFDKSDDYEFGLQHKPDVSPKRKRKGKKEPNPQKNPSFKKDQI